MLNHGEMDFLYKSLPFFPKLGEDDLRMIAATAFRSVCLSGEIILSKEKNVRVLSSSSAASLEPYMGWKMVEKSRFTACYREMFASLLLPVS